MSLIDDLRLQASPLDHLGWQEATTRVAGLLAWMREQPEVNRILHDLKGRSSVFARLQSGGPAVRREAAGCAARLEDIAAVGLAMAELCSVPNRRDAFHQIATSFGVQPPPNMVNPADFLAREAIKLYIRPLVNFVAGKLSRSSPQSKTASPTREHLTFEFLRALCDEYERDPLPTHWVKRDDIWKRVTERYGEDLDSDLATAAFKHLYAVRFVNQVTGTDAEIQINDRGLEAYEQMKADHSSPTPSDAPDTRTVFVVHGRNEAARKSIFAFLRAIGLKPLEWSQAIAATGEGTPYIGQVLDKAFSIAQAIVVLMTPDDVACLRKEFQNEQDPEHEKKLTGQARANVLFEAGMAFGRHPKRTVLVEMGALRPFSDIGGRHVLRLNDSSQRRQDLANRLQTAGCAVDLTGRDWHTAGSFEMKTAAESAGNEARRS
jgi:predicted nucleotide-binding protein